MADDSPAPVNSDQEARQMSQDDPSPDNDGPALGVAEAGEPSEPSPVPLEPPEDCEKVTSDGGVLIKVLEEGTGDVPSLHARCLVHYVGRLCRNGEVFMDTRTESQSGEPVSVVAGRDSVRQEAGIHLAVARMRQGQRALVYIMDPKYGYGEQGNFSFPSVPPDARLVYDITLEQWESAAERPERSGMLYEERLEAAERRRLDGNKLFQEAKYKEALSKYAVALSFLDEDFLMQLEGFHLDKANEVKLPIHLNMAACQLKIEDYNTAIYNCDQVLQIDKDNVKALFRRGKARHALGQTEGAQSDLEAALKLDPKDSGVIAGLRTLRQTLKQERQAQAKLFKGSFAGKMELYPEQPAARPSPPAAAAVRAAKERDSSGPLGNVLQLLWSIVGALQSLMMWALGRKQKQAQPLR